MSSHAVPSSYIPTGNESVSDVELPRLSAGERQAAFWKNFPALERPQIFASALRDITVCKTLEAENDILREEVKELTTTIAFLSEDFKTSVQCQIDAESQNNRRLKRNLAEILARAKAPSRSSILPPLAPSPNTEDVMSLNALHEDAGGLADHLEVTSEIDLCPVEPEESPSPGTKEKKVVFGAGPAEASSAHLSSLNSSASVSIFDERAQTAPLPRDRPVESSCVFDRLGLLQMSSTSRVPKGLEWTPERFEEMIEFFEARHKDFLRLIKEGCLRSKASLEKRRWAVYKSVKGLASVDIPMLEEVKKLSKADKRRKIAHVLRQDLKNLKVEIAELNNKSQVLRAQKQQRVELRKSRGQELLKWRSRRDEKGKKAKVLDNCINNLKLKIDFFSPEFPSQRGFLVTKLKSSLVDLQRLNTALQGELTRCLAEKEVSIQGLKDLRMAQKKRCFRESQFVYSPVSIADFLHGLGVKNTRELSQAIERAPSLPLVYTSGGAAKESPLLTFLAHSHGHFLPEAMREVAGATDSEDVANLTGFLAKETAILMQREDVLKTLAWTAGLPYRTRSLGLGPALLHATEICRRCLACSQIAFWIIEKESDPHLIKKVEEDGKGRVLAVAQCILPPPGWNHQKFEKLFSRASGSCSKPKKRTSTFSRTQTFNLFEKAEHPKDSILAMLDIPSKFYDIGQPHFPTARLFIRGDPPHGSKSRNRENREDRSFSSSEEDSGFRGIGRAGLVGLAFKQREIVHVPEMEQSGWPTDPEKLPDLKKLYRHEIQKMKEELLEEEGAQEGDEGYEEILEGLKKKVETSRRRARSSLTIPLFEEKTGTIHSIIQAVNFENLRGERSDTFFGSAEPVQKSVRKKEDFPRFSIEFLSNVALSFRSSLKPLQEAHILAHREKRALALGPFSHVTYEDSSFIGQAVFQIQREGTTMGKLLGLIPEHISEFFNGEGAVVIRVDSERMIKYDLGFDSVSGKVDTVEEVLPHCGLLYQAMKRCCSVSAGDPLTSKFYHQGVDIDFMSKKIVQDLGLEHLAYRVKEQESRANLNRVDSDNETSEKNAEQPPCPAREDLRGRVSFNSTIHTVPLVHAGMAQLIVQFRSRRLFPSELDEGFRERFFDGQNRWHAKFMAKYLGQVQLQYEQIESGATFLSYHDRLDMQIKA